MAMHTEGQIRKAAKILLEHYGILTTTEVIDHLQEVIDFDSEDKEESETRPGEMKIEQRVRNIISHKSSSGEVKEGFFIDDSVIPAKWINSETPSKPLDETKAKNKKEKAKTFKKDKFKKINWDAVNERNTSLGKTGEEFVYETEVEKVTNSFGEEFVKRVIHLSTMQGDGFGYDILSIDDNKKSICIEVKTTTNSNPDTPFYMSVNEYEFFKEHEEENDAFIYRVYDFKENDKHGSILIIPAKELFKNYTFDPVSFKVIKK